MYRKRNKGWKTLLEKVLWWQPVTLLVLMFILGACSYRSTLNKSFVSSSYGASNIDPIEGSDNSAESPSDNDSERIYQDKDGEAPLDGEALTAIMAGEYTSDTVYAADSNQAYDDTDSLVNISEMESIEVAIDATELFAVKEDGNYISKDDVALYIHEYGKLPSNYITKQQAEEQGWNSKEGNLDMMLPGMSIGGGHFGNYEGKLPEAQGRKYFECDIDYTGGYRNAKRIVYSNDGLIFYTEDHYNNFEQLY